MAVSGCGHCDGTAYLHLHKSDPNVFERVNNLINECRRDPFKGAGKPEPLKENLKGWWSRRIKVSDRIVYRVTGKPPDKVLEIARRRFD